MNDRIVVLVDMDCFYCQVETRLNPSLKGKPLAVVQYNQWQGGGIIAVNYEARAFGVTRSIRGNEAKKMCPDIALVHVPSVRGKADLTRYRDAGREVVDVLCRFSDTVQKASVDEAYLDITHTVNVRHKKLSGTSIKPEQLPNTFVVGYSENSNDEDKRREGVETWLSGIFGGELQDESLEKLAVAASIVEDMRAAIFEVTGFHCSAGIAHNKILSKLACGLHKPQRQTVLPQCGVPILFSTLPVHKVRGLGGKFGDFVKQRLNVTFMSELLKFSEVQLQKIFDEKSGSWLYNIARGFDDEAVTARLTSKSIGCCKKFPGKLALATYEAVEHWLGELADEVSERLEKEVADGNRKATQFVVSYMQTIDGRGVSSSRCGALTSFDPKHIVTEAMELLKRSNTAPPNCSSWVPPLKFLGLSAGKFVEKDSKTTTINSFFKLAPKKETVSLTELKDDTQRISEKVSTKAEKDKENSFMTIVDKKEESSYDSHCSNGTMKCDIDDKEKINEATVTNTKSGRCKSVEEGKKEATPKMSGKDLKKTGSSSKKSFLLSFFKLEGLITTPTSLKKINTSVPQDEPQNNEEEEMCTPKGPTGKSQEPTTSEGYRGITDRPVRFLQVDDSSNDSENTIQHWVSPGEIFPNLDEIDNDVAALLPSPMQRQLYTRLEKHKQMRESKKNKGAGKKKTRKCLIYTNESARGKMQLSSSPDGKWDGSVANTKESCQYKVKDCEDNNESSINEVEQSSSLFEKIIPVDEIIDNPDNNSPAKLNEFCEEDNLHPLNSSQMDIFASDSPVASHQNMGIVSDENKLCDNELSEENPQMKCNSSNDLDDYKEDTISSKSVRVNWIDSKPSSIEVINDTKLVAESRNMHIDVDESLKELCPHCNQLVSLVEYPEHLDFHVAADLDREINRESNLQTISHKKKVVTAGNSPKKDNKRKRGKNVSTVDKKMRSITNFFAPVR